MDIEKANFETTQRMMEARPVVVGMGKAIDVIPGMRDNLLLHAGPPITGNAPLDRCAARSQAL
jgi:hypothetical protein